MAGRKIGQKVVDWAKITDVVSAETKVPILALKGRFEARQARLNSYPDHLQPIDWSHYKDAIKKPGLVDDFQKQYSALKVPYPPDTFSEELTKKLERIEKRSLEAIKNAKETSEQLTKELEAIKAQKPLEEMTVDEYLADKPELKKKIDEDTYNYNWYLPKP
ncbi:PREDICTED: ATP synthase subunit d, mitochondrial-like [Amphimedon queenslandica]|uniref:ATP synthase subunit d, mitochondrial n=1 Tax=Amphimedon queenslandica TaxID=400682 RepID=A0A1X7U077_AMPQE|nr:PREDICTED: ATP synthase subunit d, mitochondrial-like [Amphimedon queenslandica]|eukprot:XP_003389325.1 PREDICTED: ATP synthase subunit d, mitochondrial-like [Amphimedon queenslandica]